MFGATPTHRQRHRRDGSNADSSSPSEVPAGPGQAPPIYSDTLVHPIASSAPAPTTYAERAQRIRDGKVDVPPFPPSYAPPPGVDKLSFSGRARTMLEGSQDPHPTQAAVTAPTPGSPTAQMLFLERAKMIRDVGYDPGRREEDAATSHNQAATEATRGQVKRMSFVERARMLREVGYDPDRTNDLTTVTLDPATTAARGQGERMSFTERARVMRETGGWDPEGDLVERRRREEAQGLVRREAEGSGRRRGRGGGACGWDNSGADAGAMAGASGDGDAGGASSGGGGDGGGGGGGGGAS